ncbi:MAG: hypothetical protein ACI8T1_000097 [Verrucomicrobiales bacterium]|jgi:hypothetical protein
MKEGYKSREPSAKQLMIVCGQMILVLFVMFLCLRFPFPPPVKLGLAVVVFVLGVRRILMKFRKG